jgi:ribonuclease P protein component
LNTIDTSFPRSCRITKSSEYQSFFKEGKKLHQDHFFIVIKINKLDYTRLGFVIAKKHIKKAIKRNTVKRVIRESFRYHQYLLKGVDLVVIAKKGLGELTKESFRSQLDKQWERVAKLFG